MYYWVVTDERDFCGPYTSSFQAERMQDKLAVGSDVFESDSRQMADAKQEYRAKHPEYAHANFRRQ